MFDFKSQISTIGGWLTSKEGEFLYKKAKEIPSDGKIVEIGSWKGRSTVCFGLGSKNGNGATIYAIDPHTGSSEHRKWFGKVDTYKEFLNNIKKFGLKKYIIPIKKTSEEVASEFNSKVNFVLVDGAHEYNFVKKDYELWFSKLANGGLIAFHDCWHAPGVHFLTTKLLFFSSQIRRPVLIDTLTVFEKVEKNSLLDRIYNVIFFIYRLFFGWIGTVKINCLATAR